MRRILLLTALTLLLVPGAALADVPENAEWTETYIEHPDGIRLHADILRLKGTPANAKQPVLMTVSPYTNHSGQTTDVTPTAEGPSPRFFDFLQAAQILERGYTYVIVDLRGFGGSSGCNDWGGPGEQSDVKTAVEWAAQQPWSNGRVGLYGKSYDAWTGLMGIAQRPKGLAAVISQEPVVDGYRYLYMNGVPFSNRLGTPALFQVIDAKPGNVNDGPDYQANNVYANVVKPGCYATNVTDQQNDSPDSSYWATRDLVDAVRGSRTPVFMTAGFLETNTKPDAVFELFNNLAGTSRGWFGQFDHVRGTDKDAEGNFVMGRSTFVDESVRFLERHLKGATVADDPTIEVQDDDGRWRSEAAWPPADAAMLRSALLTGAYVDDGANNGSAEGDGGTYGNGLWTFSPKLPHAAHLAGTPRLRYKVDADAADSNLAANVYDVAPDGTATMISRGAMLLRPAGASEGVLELYGQDWTLDAGHRLGVLISSANAEWWDHGPSDSEVRVTSAAIHLPFLQVRRKANLAGQSGPRLAAFRADAPFTVDAATIASHTSPGFVLPPKLR